MSTQLNKQQDIQNLTGRFMPDRVSFTPESQDLLLLLGLLLGFWGLGEVHTMTFRQQAELKMLRCSLGVSTMSPSKGQLRV